MLPLLTNPDINLTNHHNLTSFFQFIADADTQISLSVNASHTPFWDVFMLVFSYKSVWLPFYMSLVCYLLRRCSWAFSAVCLVAVALVVASCDQLSSTLLRPVIARLRPCDPENPVSAMVHLVDGYCPMSYSCPSAHAANTWGLAFFLSFLFRRRVLTMALTSWAFVTCWSRLYLGVHFLGDLLAGMLVGLLVSLLFYHILRQLGRAYPHSIFKKDERTSFSVVSSRWEWGPVAVLLITVAWMLGYSVCKVI